MRGHKVICTGTITVTLYTDETNPDLVLDCTQELPEDAGGYGPIEWEYEVLPLAREDTSADDEAYEAEVDR